MNYPVTLLSADGTKATVLSDVIGKKPAIIDFWHTRCVRCPLALEQLNEEAGLHPEVHFIACAFSLGEGNMKAVASKVTSWPNLTHVFMEEDTKEHLKDKFDIMSVPFAIAVDKNGGVVAHGDPKIINMLDAVKDDKGKQVDLAFDEDF